MRLDRILAGAAFRSTLFFLPAFLLVLVAAGGFIVNVSIATLHDELRDQISDELTLFENIYQQDGQPALTADINALDPSSSVNQLHIGLFDPSGNRLAGAVTALPNFTGWGTFTELPKKTAENADYYGIVAKLGRYTIVVSHTTRHIEATRLSLLEALFIAGTLITLVALAISFAVSHRTGEKLETIATMLERVSHGETGVRLPVGRQNDQIDHISVLINQHLERLSQLMVLTRNTTVAIAHDLRSPLNRAFLSVQEALEHTDADAPSSEHLEQALVDLEQMGSVFDTMMRIARISSSDDRAAFVSFPVVSLVQELAETYEPVIAEAGQSLSLRIDSEADATLFGDQKMVMQMIVNLIENASRYAGRDAHIHLGLEIGDEGAVIEVADNGPGIPPERREEMLQPFHRLASGGHEQGTGLGLALVQAIATRHQAVLTLADNGPGLSVKVAFPAAGSEPHS